MTITAITNIWSENVQYPTIISSTVNNMMNSFIIVHYTMTKCTGIQCTLVIKLLLLYYYKFSMYNFMQVKNQCQFQPILTRRSF